MKTGRRKPNVYGLGLIGREDAEGNYVSYHSDIRSSTTLLTDENGRVTDWYAHRNHEPTVPVQWPGWGDDRPERLVFHAGPLLRSGIEAIPEP
ncbi:hypothetical protein QYF50_00020 [Paenibacillus vini]|uniref:hypothetical protein n=1 Tax=Paenibacillus TaxID=44249 RepID=UPI001FFCED59|nr:MULTISPECIES: hypothetical protein [Paenibacillus]MDN4066259.1 hypothetical protein [Paenibacillus vini]